MEIYVDGCCNKTIGACASVVNSTGKDLITENLEFLTQLEIFKNFETMQHNGRTVFKVNFSDVKSQQNNGAELVATVIGLILAIEYNYTIIYSDSSLITDYWSKRLSGKIADKQKRLLQRILVELNKEFESKGGRIVKISGDDNLADLGFHRKRK